MTLPSLVLKTTTVNGSIWHIAVYENPDKPPIFVVVNPLIDEAVQLCQSERADRKKFVYFIGEPSLFTKFDNSKDQSFCLNDVFKEFPDRVFFTEEDLPENLRKFYIFYAKIFWSVKNQIDFLREMFEKKGPIHPDECPILLRPHWRRAIILWWERDSPLQFNDCTRCISPIYHGTGFGVKGFLHDFLLERNNRTICKRCK
jgi:hypothetical protein